MDSLTDQLTKFVPGGVLAEVHGGVTTVLNFGVAGESDSYPS